MAPPCSGKGAFQLLRPPGAFVLSLGHKFACNLGRGQAGSMGREQQGPRKGPGPAFQKAPACLALGFFFFHPGTFTAYPLLNISPEHPFFCVLLLQKLGKLWRGGQAGELGCDGWGAKSCSAAHLFHTLAKLLWPISSSEKWK